MTGHFNQLTPAQAERLAMLAEECAEVIYVIGKILRHGYGSHHPDRPHVSNRALLRHELTDLRAVMELMKLDIDPGEEMQVQIALRRMMRFAHHQEAERPDA